MDSVTDLPDDKPARESDNPQPPFPQARSPFDTNAFSFDFNPVDSPAALTTFKLSAQKWTKVKKLAGFEVPNGCISTICDGTPPQSQNILHTLTKS